MKTALLMTASWTEIATVRFSRKGWPEAIVWNRRVFTRATTGYAQEKYRERRTLHAVKVIKRARNSYVNKTRL